MRPSSQQHRDFGWVSNSRVLNPPTYPIPNGMNYTTLN